MNPVTPGNAVPNPAPETPRPAAPTEADRARELDALIQDAWMADVVVLDAEGIARAIIAAGWVSPGAHADLIEDIHETLDDYGKAVGDLNLANHRRVRVEALLAAEIASEIESRVRAARADVRCLVCNLRYEERQEYGCQESGWAHKYDEGDLAGAEEIERSGAVEHVTLSVADLRAALAEPDTEAGR